MKNYHDEILALLLTQERNPLLAASTTGGSFPHPLFQHTRVGSYSSSAHEVRATTDLPAGRSLPSGPIAVREV